MLQNLVNVTGLVKGTGFGQYYRFWLILQVLVNVARFVTSFQ